MSVADKDIDDPGYCEIHGHALPCWECRIDWADEYADQQIQTEKEGK